MDLKIWLKFVYFDSLVVDASSSAPEEKSSQQIWWKSKSSFEAQYFLLATEFWVSIDIKSDHDKPNYNPYLHKKFCSKDESFHNTEYYSEKWVYYSSILWVPICIMIRYRMTEKNMKFPLFYLANREVASLAMNLKIK